MRTYRERIQEASHDDEEDYQPADTPIGLAVWAAFLLILTALAFGSWYGSIYVFGHPERPLSYRVLAKLNKIEPPKRFELKDAPKGQFMGADRFLETHLAMDEPELVELNQELVRGYIKNYSSTKARIPYLTGRFRVISAGKLSENDLMPAGAVALAESVDDPRLLVEYLYPCDEESVPRILRSLQPGMEIQLYRTEELSAVTHLKRYPDERILATVVNLNYGSYAPSEGIGGFDLNPPETLNLAGGWPVTKPDILEKAGQQYARAGGSDRSVPRRPDSVEPVSIPVRSTIAAVSASAASPRREGSAAAPAPPARPVSAAPVFEYTPDAESEGPPEEPIEVAALATPMPPIRPAETVTVRRAEAVVTTSDPPVSVPFPTPASVARAIPPQPVPAIPVSPPVAGQQPFVAAAQPANPTRARDGGNWPTYAPGQMPRGRLVQAGEINRVADTASASERLYLSGQFVVTANDREHNRAVLRPRGGIGSQILTMGQGQQVRYIVDYPSGYTPPDAGTSIDRDPARAFQIMSMQRSGGMLNVYVREVIAR